MNSDNPYIVVTDGTYGFHGGYINGSPTATNATKRGDWCVAPYGRIRLYNDSGQINYLGMRLDIGYSDPNTVSNGPNQTLSDNLGTGTYTTYLYNGITIKTSVNGGIGTLYNDAFKAGDTTTTEFFNQGFFGERKTLTMSSWLYNLGTLNIEDNASFEIDGANPGTSNAYYGSGSASILDMGNGTTLQLGSTELGIAFFTNGSQFNIPYEANAETATIKGSFYADTGNISVSISLNNNGTTFQQGTLAVSGNFTMKGGQYNCEVNYDTGGSDEITCNNAYLYNGPTLNQTSFGTQNNTVFNILAATTSTNGGLFSTNGGYWNEAWNGNTLTLQHK
jgi:hypothetical protein